MILQRFFHVVLLFGGLLVVFLQGENDYKDYLSSNNSTLTTKSMQSDIMHDRPSNVERKSSYRSNNGKKTRFLKLYPKGKRYPLWGALKAVLAAGFTEIAIDCALFICSPVMPIVVKASLLANVIFGPLFLGIGIGVCVLGLTVTIPLAIWCGVSAYRDLVGRHEGYEEIEKIESVFTQD